MSLQWKLTFQKTSLRNLILITIGISIVGISLSLTGYSCGIQHMIILNEISSYEESLEPEFCEIIIEKIKQLLNIIDITSMDKEVVFGALNSKFKDFEDALQNFSAIENGQISIILTRNVKDYKKSKLAVLTPETYLKGKASG